ncbi:MAG TPA: tetratricopeptide repeat protein [Verrucomicrobiae bacterium]|nr:tetratricopeptide repeat protein [Verrucomicrobiae bacterium]
MGEIIKLPVQAAKFGYKRVPGRTRDREDPAQLPLFPPVPAEVLYLSVPESPFAHALLLDERGDPRAVDLYLKAIAEQNCVADAYCNLGIIESKKGNTSKALDCLTKALKHDPRHSEAHYNLANIYLDLNDFRLAQIHYEISVEIDPKFPNALFNLALVLSINKDFTAAIAALTKYQEIAAPADARKSEELLDNLRKSLTAAGVRGASIKL